MKAMTIGSAFDTKLFLITQHQLSRSLGDLVGSPPHDFNSDEEMRSRKGRGGYKAQAAKRKFKTGAWRK